MSLAAQYQVPMARKSRCAARSASAGGVTGSASPDKQQGGNVALQGAVQVGIHRTARPELANFRKCVELIRALVGLRDRRPVDASAAKNGTSSLQMTLFCMPLAS